MTLTDYLLNLALVGLVYIQIKGHKITVVRLLVPLGAVAYAATQYLHSVPTAGNDLVLEAGLAAIGCALGVLAGLATSVRPVDDGAFAKAGPLAAFLWILGIGARMAFEIWASHGARPAWGDSASSTTSRPLRRGRRRSCSWRSPRSRSAPP